ncbi:MAG TPA: MTH938/NDUFAF3 family protein [Candidatus Thermoplasmatota archaeon]|nr:MTH938/NDUFAF3 family protein [Candidatus Thermoplasmatota archaeon]
MNIKFVDFGEIEINGKTYDYDVVIDQGEIRKRKKKPSKKYKETYNHTPLSLEEKIPWGGKELIVGIGVEGKLPVMPEVLKEAKDRGITIVRLTTEEACKALAKKDFKRTRAILHVTC